LVLEGNLFLFQVETQTEMRFQFTRKIGVYYLLKVPKKTRFFDEKKKKYLVRETNK